MKRMKKFLSKTFVMLLVLCTFVCLVPQKAQASESEAGFTTLTVTATVASEYDGEIAFVFTQKNTGFNYSLLLTKDNGYTGTLSIVGNMEYTAIVTIKKDASNYSVSGLSDSYNVTGSNVELKFEVKKGVTAVESTQNSGDSTSIPQATTGTETESTTLTESQQIYADYINAVSFMDGNKDFDTFLNNYDNDIMKKYFLNAESTNTENDWEQMSKFDKFNYYILFVRTKTLIAGENAVSSEEALINELSSESTLLNTITDGSKVLEAIKTVWRYEYEYYQQTGNFINLYDPYTKGAAQKYSTTELTDDDKAEIEQAQNELKKEKDTTGSRLKRGVMNNILSIIILAVIGIGLVVVIIIKRKKNYDDLD